MKGILRSVAAIAAVLVAASACTSSHSATGTAHAEAAQKPAGLSTAAKVHKILVDQGQMPPVQTAADFCLKGVLKDEKDTLVSKAIDVVDPTAGDVWDAYSLSGDLDDTVTLYKQDGEFAGTFQLGQFLANLISSFGQKVTAGTPLEFQFYLFDVLGEAAIYCAEAALWLDDTVGGQIGTEIRHLLLSPQGHHPTPPPTSPGTNPAPTPPPTSPGTEPTPVPDPPPTTPSVPSAQCVLLLPDQTYCRSTDPTVILEAENIGDTSDCTFSDTIYWSDGSPPQTLVYQGADNVPEVVANHTYKQLGAYGITADDTVVDGPCTAITGEYTFAYVTDG
jgi:hypothetical protein